MRSTSALYPLIDTWLHALDGRWHASARQAVAQLLTALLVAQSLHPADLLRALDCPSTVPARQRFKRVARFWDRRWLAPDWLTPRLVRAVLRLVPPDPASWPTAGLTHLVLDSVRCGRWEIFTVGVRSHGRVLLVGWTVLPYPWPKGAYTPAVCALLRQVAGSWPAERAVHLVAERGFASQAVLRTLAQLGWDFTIRLRASARLVVAGQDTTARTLLEGARRGQWTRVAASYGGTRVSGQVLIGRDLVVLPWHQRDAGSQRHRARLVAEQTRQRTKRRPGRAQTDAWVVLFTTLATVRAATGSYRGRWATAGTYRDLQGGWDGRHGWDLEGVLAHVRCPEQVTRLVGLAALGLLVQSWVGIQALHRDQTIAPVRSRLSPRAGRRVAGSVSGAMGTWR